MMIPTASDLPPWRPAQQPDPGRAGAGRRARRRGLLAARGGAHGRRLRERVLPALRRPRGAARGRGARGPRHARREDARRRGRARGRRAPSTPCAASGPTARPTCTSRSSTRRTSASCTRCRSPSTAASSCCRARPAVLAQTAHGGARRGRRRRARGGRPRAARLLDVRARPRLARRRRPPAARRRADARGRARRRAAHRACSARAPTRRCFPPEHPLPGRRLPGLAELVREPSPRRQR